MKSSIFFLLAFFSIALKGQIIPVPGSNLLHTQVMFEYPTVTNVAKYKIEICQWDSVRKVSIPFHEQFDKTTATLVSGLNFGFEYKWKYLAFDKNDSLIFISKEFVFYIKNKLEVSEDFQRVRINTANSKNLLNGLITFDYCKIITDRNGIPVCYIPEIQPFVNREINIRDLRVTPGGTFTFLARSEAIEINLDGKILWRAPNDGKVSGCKTEFYHHAFRKLPNGNYMILSEKPLNINSPGDTTHIAVNFGTIIEYDNAGKIIWKWDSREYLKNEDLLSRKKPDNTYDVITHCNSFDIDKDGECVFLGFRDISRIIKIEKKTGKVIGSYGNRMPSGEAKYGNGFFKFQHSCNLLLDGNIVVFNNDSISDPKITSSVVIFSQADRKNMSSELVWKFDCKFDTLTDGKSLRTGNVIELPSGNILVNMGFINRTFEVTRNKKVIWDAFTEKWNPEEKKWISFPQYKSSYISSLYPCYFTASLSKNIKKRERLSSVTLIIYNEGSEPDEYSIIIEKGTKFTEILSHQVMPDSLIKINIPKSSFNEFSKIKLISSLDKRRYRTIDIQNDTQESTLNSLPFISPSSFTIIEEEKSKK